MNFARWMRVLSRLEREYDDETDDRTLRDRIQAWADDRLYRADVVAVLPVNAPPGKLMVTPGDTHLYVGTGAASPLRKIPTQPLT